MRLIEFSILCTEGPIKKDTLGHEVQKPDQHLLTQSSIDLLPIPILSSQHMVANHPSSDKICNVGIVVKIQFLFRLIFLTT